MTRLMLGIVRQVSPLETSLKPVEQVPVDDYTLPLGKIDVVREGADLTLVSFGTPLYTCRRSSV
jgi:pyruvate/2-oxoglutarate/acetoin dehydrogenase E1 component